MKFITNDFQLRNTHLVIRHLLRSRVPHDLVLSASTSLNECYTALLAMVHKYSDIRDKHGKDTLSSKP